MTPLPFRRPPGQSALPRSRSRSRSLLVALLAVLTLPGRLTAADPSSGTNRPGPGPNSTSTSASTHGSPSPSPEATLTDASTNGARALPIPATTADETHSTNSTAAKPETAAARDSRDGRASRRTRGNRDSRGGSESRAESAAADESASTSTDSPSGRLDYPAFRLIAERNIFNTKRSARVPGGATPPRETRRTAKVETLSLVGTMESAKGTTAFFDGSSADYRKALAPGATIAGFKVAEVTFSGARLHNGTNTFDLKVTQQLRREDEGEWTVAATAATSSPSSSTSGETTASPAPSTSSGGGASEAAVSDIVRRLMQQREKD